MNQLRYRTAAHAAPHKIGTRLSAPPLLPRGLALLGRYCGNDASGGGTVAWREEQQLVLRMEEKELRDWKARPCAESLWVISDSNFFPTFEKIDDFRGNWIHGLDEPTAVNGNGS